MGCVIIKDDYHNVVLFWTKWKICMHKVNVPEILRYAQDDMEIPPNKKNTPAFHKEGVSLL